MSAAVAMRAPTRMDFGGGWTDVPPYCDREGGAVCAATLTRYATAIVREHSSAFSNTPPDSPLVRAALARTDLTGKVLVELRSDFPVSAGLGGSSSALTALLGALDIWRGHPIDRVAIAERAHQIELEDMGVAGGRQDRYCATHGGLLGLRFGAGADVKVERLSLPPAFRAAIESRCILVYTGESRVSGQTISAVLDAYGRGERGVTHALARLRETATDMIAACRAADVDALGELLAETWTHQRALHPTVPTPRIDAIVERTRAAGALGAKATGASGGGCVVIIARQGAEDAVRRTAAALGELIPFTLDTEGLSACDANATLNSPWLN